MWERVPTTEWRPERTPVVRRLRQPVADRVDRGRVEPESAVAAAHLDVLGLGADLLDALPPPHDAVGAGVDRRGRNGQRAGIEARQQFVEPDRVGRLQTVEQRRCGAAVVGRDAERAAERDHLAHHLGPLAGQAACVDPAEAPADQADRAAVAVVQILKPIGQPVDDVLCRAEVAPQPPAVDPIPLTLQDRPQRSGRRIAGQEAGQDQYRVVVATTDHPQQRRCGGDRPELEQGP